MIKHYKNKAIKMIKHNKDKVKINKEMQLIKGVK